MKRPRLLLLATTSVITIGAIAWLVIHRPLIQPPPFSFIPTSDDLIHLQIELKEPVPASCSFYSFPTDFNSICLQADAELLPQDYKAWPLRFSSTNTDERSDYSSEMRTYMCKERVSTGSAVVVIQNNRILEKGRSRLGKRAGWVTVQVLDSALTLAKAQEVLQAMPPKSVDPESIELED
jgi:hypothetical protein